MTLLLPTDENRRIVWESIGYDPHNGQLLVHDSTARHRVASCGRRFGKSTLGGDELVALAIETALMAQDLEKAGRRRWYWIVGPNYDDVAKEWRVLWDGCERLKLPFDRPGTYNDTIGGNMRISLWNGRFVIEGKSAQYPNSLDGEGLDGVLMVEAAKMKPVIWNKYIRPALADHHGWSLHTSTPEGRNHFYEFWQRGQSPQYPNWDSWRMPSWANNVIFPGGRQDPEIVDMKLDMSDERFEQEIAAKFTEFVGLVFKNFDEEVHVKDLHFRGDLPLFGACDYGFTNPFVWLVIQVDVWGNVYVLREYRVEKVDVGDIAVELADWPLASKAQAFYPDPASPGDTNQISRKIGVAARGDTGGPLKERIEYIRQALKVGPEHAKPEEQLPKLFIDRRCKGLINEMGLYRYPDTQSEMRPNKEEPVDKDNHGPEALGRFFRGYFGPPSAAGGGRAVIRTARVSG